MGERMAQMKVARMESTTADSLVQSSASKLAIYVNYGVIYNKNCLTFLKLHGIISFDIVAPGDLVDWTAA